MRLLILIPVVLARTSAADRFKLRWRHEDVASNLSLEAFLDREHRLKMPAFEAGEDLNLVSVLRSGCRNRFSKRGGGRCCRMHRNLASSPSPSSSCTGTWTMSAGRQTASWHNKELIRSILADGFEHLPLTIPEDAFVDDYIPVSDMLHVADADSSSNEGHSRGKAGAEASSFKGSPGTGKSQTIANIIATAVADETVFFVAEAGALSVVKSMHWSAWFEMCTGG